MHDFSAPAWSALIHAALTLAIGAAIAVTAAAAAERVVRCAAWRRVLWQSAILGIFALMVIEATGSPRALAEFWARMRAAPIAAPGGPCAPPSPLPSWQSAAVFDETWASDPGLEIDAFVLRQESAFEAQAAGASSADAIILETSGDQSRPAPAGAEAARQWGALLVLPALWGAVAAVLVGRIGWRRWRLARLLRSWPMAESSELAGEVAALCAPLGYRRRVRVGVAGRLPTPVALGLLRPTVLVPADFARRFTPGEQRVILAHELAHLAAGDPAWLLAADLLAAMLWWHPAVHWCRRRLETVSEQAADEASLLLPDGPDVLADCLVKLGRRLAGKTPVGWVAADGSGLRSGLARRVERLLDLRGARRRLPQRRTTALMKPAFAGLLVLVTVFCTLWVHPKATYAKGDETMNVLKISWRQSLAAVALAAVLGPAGGVLAEEEKPAAPKPAQLEQGSPADLILLAQGEERKEAEKKREAGERREGEKRPEGDRPREAEKRPEGDRPREADRPREGEKRPEGDRPREAERRPEGERPREVIERRVDEARERIQAHREQLRQRMEAIMREINALREKAQREGKPVEAGPLERELEEIQSQLKRLEAEMGARGGPPREAVERLQALAQEIRELRAAGRIDAAEKLEREMMELRARLGGPREGERPGPAERERAEARERLGAMVREVQKLREAGKNEEAERLAREVEELHRRLAGPREGERPGVPPDLRVKLGHLRSAMENLRAAGLADQAEQVAQQIERLVRELPPEVRERAMAPGPPREGMPGMVPGPPREGMPGMAGGPPREGPPQLQAGVVGELRGEIERLRRESEEMRRMINELREGQERLLRELGPRPR